MSWSTRFSRRPGSRRYSVLNFNRARDIPGKQGFEDKTVLRHVELQVGGATFEAEYRVFLKDALAEIVLAGNKFDESFCRRFLDWAKPMFGPPAKVIDISPPDGKDEVNTILEADWLFGATRVQFTCAGLRIADNFVPAFAALIYRHHTMLKALEDLIYIECFSTRKYAGRFSDERGATEEDKPMRFMINPNDNSVRRWNKLTIGKTQRYSDEEIVTTWSDEKFSSVLRLDRRAGSYLLQTRLRGDERSGLDRWGKCSRTTSEKKF